jgi:hypothetical protein
MHQSCLIFWRLNRTTPIIDHCAAEVVNITKNLLKISMLCAIGMEALSKDFSDLVN